MPLELILLDLSSPRYANHPLRAYMLRKEIARTLGENVLDKMPEEGRAVPSCYTRDEYLEVLGAPAMEELIRSAYERNIADIGRRHVDARYSVKGGAREQKKKHCEAYQAAYESGECTTHASFVKKYAGTPGFSVEPRVLARHLKGMPSARKKQTHTP